MIALMREAWVVLALAYYRLALRSVGGAHEDTGYIVLRIRDLQDEISRIRSGVTQQ